jgi:hypothetical protein
VKRRVPELAALSVGALVGLVSLETAGLAMLLLIPAGVVLKQRRAARIPFLMVTFAVGYLLAIGFFALRTSGILNGDGVDWGVAAYFASLAGVGVALLIAGTVISVRARHRGAEVVS